MKIDEVLMNIDENRHNSLTNEGPMGLHLSIPHSMVRANLDRCEVAKSYELSLIHI